MQQSKTCQDRPEGRRKQVMSVARRKQKGIENKEWSGRTQRRWIDGNGNSGERGLALCQQQANAAVSDAVGC
ncbi:Electron transfer flavoprotein regulatory factor 1 [Fusarium oxysporum f. sp. albedinis]|nr:Electron transfer flavoprotein regulatory factor 1 [Fusarium oxysporum f. sp. albedinis]